MSTSMLKEIKKVKEKVELVLMLHPSTRNSDNLLCSIYWQVFDGVEHLDGVAFATSAESIRRSRQQLNQAGLYLATDPLVLQRRNQQASEMRRGINRI